MTGAETKTASQRIAQFASGLDLGSLPHGIVERLKDCLIDGLENALQAKPDRRISAAIASVPKGPNLPCPIWRTDQRTDPLNGAFVNGVIGAIVPRNDIHPASAGHAGSVIIPALLAAASDREVSGRDFLAAMLTGYETIARVGAVLLRPGLSSNFRPTALSAPIGAAVAVGRLLRLSAEEIASGAELATHSAFGLNEWARAGTGEDAFHSGWGARNGFSAALLAAGGARGSSHAFEGQSGLFAGYAVLDRLPMLTEGLGERFEILNVQHKPVGACLMVQAPSQLAEQLAMSPGFDHRKVERIDIAVSEQARNYPGCDNAGPVETVLASIMSIQFSVAAVLGAGSIKQELWSDFGNAATRELIGKVHLTVDPEYTAGFPLKQGARVSIRFTDGGQAEIASPDYVSLGSAAIRQRFTQTANTVMRPEQVAHLLNSIDSLQESPSVRVIQEMFANTA
ncbi:2-methylcitrate dehydratase PrpD [Neorhizobium galegae]|uniref:MmgE/PrpD family protein n=1 Tax=Neorhizobium galegae TaxID=399 RepID=UPI002780546C|nr:MmgE/PrpD family protein [Neorhizobium galegae]MDQ0137704.1 2-methylcitrate dehydratase PrpD [Neorhizobium galegae]